MILQMCLKVFEFVSYGIIGIGLISKVSKNTIKWEGQVQSKAQQLKQNKLIPLKKEYQTLKEEDQKLEEWIMQMKEKLNSLAEDENYKKYAYVTYDDIKKLTSSNNQQDTLLAIRAPANSEISVLDKTHVERLHQKLEEKIKNGDQEAQN